MSTNLHPRAVELSTPKHDLTRRHFLDGWDAAGFDSLKFSYGLTGVDQAGNYMWVDAFIYILVACSVGLLTLRFVNMFFKHARHMTAMTNPHRQEYWKHNRTGWWPWMNRHIFMAPLHKQKHNATFQISSAIDNGTLPGRWHFIMLVIYGALNIAWCLALPWSTAERQSVVAALRGRSGTLAALNLLPTILFALRNNPLIAILKVSYDDFNLFHRWAARITIAEAIVHTSCWLYNTIDGGGISAAGKGLSTEGSYGWGMVSTCAFVFLGIQAWSPFRHAFYETFLGVHRLMVLVSLVGLWEHLARHGLPQIPWMYIIFAFYSFEIVARFTWSLYYNAGQKGCKVRVEAMPGEACRVTITLAREWTPKPGCNVHLYMPRYMWFHSHPFSVAWAYPPTDKASKERSLSQLEGGITVTSPHAPQRTNHITLICRARTGFTRTIYEKACESPNKFFDSWGFIEGPYGGHHSLDSYGTALLIAGGVGITHQVMYIKHLLAGAHTGTTATRRILLVWSLPDSESLEWIRPWMDEILRMPDRKRRLRIKLFITKPKGRIEQGNSESVKLFAGRPNWKTLVQEEMTHREGAMAVTVCGSGGLSDACRAAVRPWVTEGCVDFIEESFSY